MNRIKLEFRKDESLTVRKQRVRKIMNELDLDKITSRYFELGSKTIRIELGGNEEILKASCLIIEMAP